MSAPAERPDPPDSDTDSAPVADPHPSAAPVGQPPKRFLLLLTIAAVVLVLDLVTKIIAVAVLTPGESPRILGGLVYFSLIRNPGAAFSLATGMTWVLALIAIAVVVFIIRIAGRLRSLPWAIGLGLVLGGAIGNLIDRIFRAPGFLQGHVVDFVSVFGPNAEYFPVFNVADSAITIGGITVVITALLGYDFDGTRSSGSPKAAPADGARGKDADGG